MGRTKKNKNIENIENTSVIKRNIISLKNKKSATIQVGNTTMVFTDGQEVSDLVASIIPEFIKVEESKESEEILTDISSDVEVQVVESGEQDEQDEQDDNI
jgi:hypothetical protein